MKIFDYSNVLYYHDVVVVVKKGNEFNFNTIQDLKGKTVAVLRGASYTDDYANALKTGLFIPCETKNRKQRMLLVLHDRVDAALIGGGLVGIQNFVSRSPELKGKFDQFSVLPKPLLRDSNYLAISKKLNAVSFIKAFNNALKMGNKSGEFDKYKKRYIELLTNQ